MAESGTFRAGKGCPGAASLDSRSRTLEYRCHNKQHHESLSKTRVEYDAISNSHNKFHSSASNIHKSYQRCQPRQSRERSQLLGLALSVSFGIRSGPASEEQLVDSACVGKSSLTVQFVDGHFVESYYPTIENTFSKVIKHKGQEFATEIIDTAGQVSCLPPDRF